MGDRFLTLIELRQRLIENGHRSWPEPANKTTTDIWPLPDIIVTVAMYADGALNPVLRERYFVTVEDAEDSPLLQYEWAFALPKGFAAAAEQEPPRNEFMNGPVRWLLVRLQQFRHVLLWPKDEHRQPDGTWLWHPEERNEVPELCGRLREATRDPSAIGAIVMDLAEPRDCIVLWQVANLVAWTHHNFYVSDLDGREVYFLHHHDCIFLSIPSPQAREALLEDLAQWPDILKDCSGYVSEIDNYHSTEASEGR